MNALMSEYKAILSKLDKILMRNFHINDDIRREISWLRREARLSLLSNNKPDAQRRIARLRTLSEKLEDGENPV